MKRPIQFVLLVAMALLACQPLLAYAACAPQSCSQAACPPACCAEMTHMGGMHHGASTHAMTACVSLIEPLPANSGCSQNAPSIAVLSREIGTALSAAGKGHGTDTTAATALAISPLPPIATLLHASPEERTLPDRGILFHVFRI
jgi:hypothetical protein